jgi:hypothetical protein
LRPSRLKIPGLKNEPIDIGCYDILLEQSLRDFLAPLNAARTAQCAIPTYNWFA